jgi:hypothetical protein
VRLPVLVDLAFVPIEALELRQRHRFHMHSVYMMRIYRSRWYGLASPSPIRSMDQVGNTGNISADDSYAVKRECHELG